MSKLKLATVVFTFVMLLLSSIFLPTVLIKLYDQTLLGSLKSEYFEGNMPNNAVQLDIQKRLALICGYRDDKNIAMTFKQHTLSDEDKIKYKKNVEIEIDKMKKIGAFPKSINIELGRMASIDTITFSDTLTIGTYVQVYKIDLTCAEYGLSVFMDTQTKQIYHYELSLSQPLKDPDLESLMSAYSEYIGVKLSPAKNSKPYRQDYEDVTGTVRYGFKYSDREVLLTLYFGEN